MILDLGPWNDGKSKITSGGSTSGESAGGRTYDWAGHWAGARITGLGRASAVM